MDFINESLQEIECLSSYKLGEVAVQYTEEGPDMSTSQMLKQVLESELDDPLETKYKKLLALGALVAQQNDVLPEGVGYENSTELATIIDESVTQMKVAYQVASKGLDLDYAADYLIDKAAARVSGIVDIAFETGVAGEMMTDGIIIAANAIPYVGPAISATLQSCRPMVREVVKMVEKPVQNLIHKGINYMSNAAKPLVHRVVSTVTTTVKTVAKSIFKSIFS